MALAQRSNYLHASALLLSCLATVACGSVADQGPLPQPPAVQNPDKPPTAPPPSTKPFEITWGTCSIPSGGRNGPIEAECATVDAPARRGVEGSGTVPVAVYRLKARKQPASAQLWMLNGGPGGAGFGLAPYGDLVVSTFQQDIDVYLIDHRGTGESAYLDCPKAYQTARDPASFARLCSAEVRGQFGDRIDGFSTTESAHDVRELIDSTVLPAQKVFVYGGSYGSYWAHRLLQIPQTHVDAVVTDGNCLSSTCTFDKPQSFALDEPMRAILDQCKDDATCRSKLGDDPWQFAVDTIGRLASGHCAGATLARYAPADLMMSIGPIWAAGTVSTLYRLNRCSAADVVALNTLEQKLQEINGQRLRALPLLGPTPKPNQRHNSSTALQLHVIASEMISRPAPTVGALRQLATGLTFKPGEDSFDISMFDSWKGYPRDSLVDGWVNRDVPWLVMQGTFDFQTVYSLSQTALPQIIDPSLQFVRVGGGGHGVAFDSECSLKILEGFFADPKAKVDASCMKTVLDKSLEIDRRYSQYFYGTPNAWD